MTANFYRPVTTMEILDGLPAAVRQLKADSVTDIVGTLQDGRNA